MKILACSDFHADWVTDGVERFEELERSANEVVDCAIEEKVELFLFLGDLCNPGTSRAHRAVAMASHCARRLTQAGIPSMWISGNHDVAEDGHGTSTVGSLGDLTHARVVVDPRSYPYGCAWVVALPFTPRSHQYDPAEFVRKALEDGAAAEMPIIIAGHLNIEGIGPGSEADEFARGRNVFFPSAAVGELMARYNVLALNGHYHGAQTFGEVVIPGALGRLTHGEEKNTPGFIIAETTKTRGKKKAGWKAGWKVERYDLDHAARLTTIVPSPEGLSEGDLRVAAGTYARVLPPSGFAIQPSDCERQLLEGGALAAKVMPFAASRSVLATNKPKRERVGHRVVVEQMVAESHSKDKDALGALCGLVMDQAGM